MTEERARQAANLVMAAAALGAAVFVFRSPKMRRMAWQLARQYAAGPLAAWTATTVRDAWDASAREKTGEHRPSRDAAASAPLDRSGTMVDRSAPEDYADGPKGPGDRSAGFAG